MGPKLKLILRVVIHDLDDSLLAIEDARGSIRRVALGGDPLVPIVIGIGGVLNLDRLEPGILSRRLIKVPVDADEAIGHGFPRAPEW